MESTRTNDRIADVQMLFRKEGMEFNHENGWQVLAGHIDMHRYHLNKSLSMEVTWQEAVFSWYENVYTPLVRVIDTWGVRSAFPGKSLGDIYLAVSDHWLYLKEEDSSVTAEEATLSFVEHYGQGLARWFSRFLIPLNA